MRPKQSFKASNRELTRLQGGCPLESCCDVNEHRQQRASLNVRYWQVGFWREIQSGGSLSFKISGHNISMSTWLSIGVLASGQIGFLSALSANWWH